MTPAHTSDSTTAAVPKLSQTPKPHSDKSLSPIPVPRAVVPVLNLDRDQLFSQDVARDVGLDPETMVVIEVPNGSSSLYRYLLFYASHYAVDIDHPLPEAPPPEPVVQQDQKSKSGASRVPPKPQFTRGISGVAVPIREGPGRLTSLWNCPDDRCDPLSMIDSDSDSSGSDSESETDDSDVDDNGLLTTEDDANEGDEPKDNGDVAENAEENPDAEKPADSTNGFGEFYSLGALRKRTEPPVQRYQMGIGYGKVRVGENVVYLHHCAFGLPVSDNFNTQMYRTVALAAKDAQPIKELCALALKWHADRDQANQRARPGRFTLFRFKTNNGCGDWCNQGHKRSRPPKSVILPDGQLEAIIRDIKDFVGRETKAWYEAHGLPHRRSFLFHGPPGCGKTSTIKMIAGMFRLKACFLSLTSMDFSNQVLHDALSTMPRRALLVLEDVDVLFNEDRKSEVNQALTFSGMLNALDGLVSIDGIITIFTTNHIEKLDPALIRGGRVDRRFEFVHPNAKQLASLFKSFYEDASDDLAERFADTVIARPEEEARSIATLQQHFIFTRKMCAERSVEMIPDFFAEFYPKGGKSRNPLYI